jgi:hypothetical protein
MRPATLLVAVAAATIVLASAVDGVPPLAALDTAHAVGAARTPPGLLITVVSRDGVVNPGRTSTVTALCGRTQAAVSWGFTTISFPAGGPVNALLRAVVPIVRANGLVAGWRATLRNPNDVPVSVRLQATCALPQGGLRLRGTGQRALQAARGERTELTFTLLRIEGELGPREAHVLQHQCPGRRIPLAVAFDLGDLRVTDLFPFLEDGFEPKVAIRLENPSDVSQRYVIWLLCLGGSDPDAVARGPDDGEPKAGELVLEIAPVTTLVVGGDDLEPDGFTVTCNRGANLGIGHRLPDEVATLRGLEPLDTAWVHAAKSGAAGKFDARRRFVIFLPSGPAAVPLELVASCLKSAKVKVFADGSVRLRF